ncbi:MAG: AAA family ATPase [Kiritimatiellae bacterium]|nr:AAA family ATPase [Kiritimatiellia bacterium]
MATWYEQFDTQIRIRRAVILHGSVLDDCWSPEPGYGRGMPLPEFVAKRLRAAGFEHVVRWDSVNGVRPEGEGAQRAFEDDVAASVAVPQEGSATGSDYDIGGGVGGNTPSAPLESMRTAQDFFGVLLRRFTRPPAGARPTAYIVDGSDVLFGDARQLSAAERELLLRLETAFRDAPEGPVAGLRDIVVFTVPRLSLMPVRFHQDTARVADVFVGPPDRAARAEFLKRNIAELRVRENVADGAEFDDLVDLLEGFGFTEMRQLFRLSSTFAKDDPPSYRRLVALYRYGEKSSPWEELSHEKLSRMADELKERVKGQDQVIRRVDSVIKRAYMGLSGLQHSGRQQMPKGTFFFVGPTGVGKTETAKALARFLFGDEEACIRFDMSEFSTEQSDQRLIGAPPGYVGYEEGGQLTNAVKRRPFSVILFDEIEKAHGRIFDKFLQILEDGRLTDSKGDTVSFAETVIIFTSNIGAAEVKVDDPNPGEKFIQKVREHFVNTLGRPELLNRLGEKNILPFNHLMDSSVLMKIAAAKIAPLRKKLRDKYRAELELADEAVALEMLLKGHRRENGGRGIANRVADMLIDPLSEWMFALGPNELVGRTIVARPNKEATRFMFSFREGLR